MAASVLGALLALFIAPGAPTAEPARQELVVFQASSLKDAFARLAQRFEEDHAAVSVVMNSAGSHELRTQLEHGASADVFATADRKHMDALAAQGLVAASSVFACNQPVIVVRAGFHPRIESLVDLPRAARIVVGTPEGPIGAYTSQILQSAAARYGADFVVRLESRIVSRELNVRQVLSKVVLGEADAGIVYRSDARTAGGKVQVVDIPSDLNVIAAYLIAPLKAAPHPDLARRWLALVRSPVGTTILHEAGFSRCPSR